MAVQVATYLHRYGSATYPSVDNRATRLGISAAGPRKHVDPPVM